MQAASAQKREAVGKPVQDGMSERGLMDVFGRAGMCLNKRAHGDNWGGRWESNPQRPEPQSGALPVELLPPNLIDYNNWRSLSKNAAAP